MFDGAGSALGSLLGGIGTVLDTPRSLLYKAGNAAYKGITGDTGPDIEHFSDILGRAGMDQDSALTKALGFAGDMATDPLTYVGAPLAKAAFKGLKGGTGVLGKAASGAESLAGGAALKPQRAGVLKFGKVQDFPAEFAQEFDPLNKVVSQGGKLNDGADVLAGQLRSGGKGVSPDEITERFRSMAPNLDGAVGVYDPRSRAIGVRATPPLEAPVGDGAAAAKVQSANDAATVDRVRTTRHENVHAMIDSAAMSGNTKGMPLMMSIPAKLKRAGGNDLGTFLGGAGTIGDELAAQTLENRTLFDKLSGGARFAFDPEYNAAYSKLFAEGGVNPKALALYRNLPRVPGAAGAVAPHSVSSLLQSLGD